MFCHASRDPLQATAPFLTYIQFPAEWLTGYPYFRCNGCWDMWADLSTSLG